MRRLAAVVRWGAFGVVLGAALGAVEGALAVSIPGESTGSRIAGLAALDAMALGALFSVLGVFAALFRSPRVRPAWQLVAALGVWLALLGGLAWRGSQAAVQLQEAVWAGWRLERPVPRLRDDASSGRAPPVVLITLDTLRADMLDPEHMPRLAAWAAKGQRYTQARALSPWTLPSLATLHTGLSPGEHRAGRRLAGGDPLRRGGLGAGPSTLAESLADAGYVNAAVVTNPFLGPAYGLHRGFDRYRDLTRRAQVVHGLRRSRLIRWLLPAEPHTADRVTRRALNMLGLLHEGRFFLWVHYLDAHAPYSTQPEGFDPFAACEAPDCFDLWARLRSGLLRFGPDEQAYVRGLYETDVAWLDAQLDDLLAGLEARGVFERGLVVLVADHGEEFWEHGGGEHGATFFDEVMRVPLVVWTPDGVAGEVSRPVDLAGLAPAILAYTAGEGLGPLEAEGAPARTGMASLLFGDEASACTDGVGKLIRAADGSLTLFDLIADPGETDDVAAARPDRVAELMTCLPAPMAASAEAGGGVEQLRALGYVD